MLPATPTGPARPAFNLRRFLGRFLRLLTFTLVVLVLIAWCLPPIRFVYVILHPGPTPLSTRLDGLPFRAEEVAIPTHDGLTLRGWFGRVAADAPVILFEHGYPGTREQMIPYAEVLYQAGYNVLLYDMRDWGASDGDMTTFGLHESDDTAAVMDYLSARPDLAQPRFGGLGVSYGAGLVLLAAAHDHRLAAVVSDSTYPSAVPMLTQGEHLYMRLWPYHIQMAPVGALAANLMLSGRLDDLAPVKQAPAVSPSALLLIHGAQDFNPLTLQRDTEAIYAAAQEPKAVWMAPQGEHAGVLFADPDGYRDHVVAFFDRYLRGR